MRALLVAACALLLALGLAWVQIASKRALAPEIAIEHTPLHVRPPAGWIQAADDPGRFFLPPPAAHRRQFDAIKQFTISYQRPGFFISPFSRERQVPTRLGGLPAVQTRVRRPHEGSSRVDQVVSRVTCSPRGDLIRIDYIARAGLSMADLELLNEIAESVRIDAPGAIVPAADALARCGVRCATDEGWIGALPFMDGVAGGFIGGVTEGIPVWSLGLFRSWLAPGRTPEDLMADFAIRHWPDDAGRAAVMTSVRADGVSVARVARPSGVDSPVAAGWIVAADSGRVCLVTAYATLEFTSELAAEAAQRVVDELTFTTEPGFPDIDAAARLGQALVERVVSTGPGHWWDNQTQRDYYIGRSPLGAQAYLAIRAPTRGESRPGYRGVDYLLRGDGDERYYWSFDGVAKRPIGYRFVHEQYVHSRVGRQQLEQRTTEARDAGATRVVRVRQDQSSKQQGAFETGPGFVVPGIETLVQFVAAREDVPALLIESTALQSRGATTQLLRPLPSPDAGEHKLLIQHDVAPQGMLVVFDKDGTMLRVETSSIDFARVTQQEAEGRFPRLRDVWFEWLDER